MNNTRRKALNKIAEELREINERLEALRDEEQEYQENMPENLQESDAAFEPTEFDAARTFLMERAAEAAKEGK